jgi:hypothetical protein
MCPDADKLGDADRMVAAGSMFAGEPAPIDTRAVRSMERMDRTVAPLTGVPMVMPAGDTGAGEDDVRSPPPDCLARLAKLWSAEP